MPRAKIAIRPNKFNEIFSSANRFVVCKKADNPFLQTRTGRVAYVPLVADERVTRTQELAESTLVAKK
jgi:hypothetical protein